MNKIFNLVIVSALVFGFANSAYADSTMRGPWRGRCLGPFCGTYKPARLIQNDSSEGTTNAGPFRKICNKGRTVCW